MTEIGEKRINLQVFIILYHIFHIIFYSIGKIKDINLKESLYKKSVIFYNCFKKNNLSPIFISKKGNLFENGNAKIFMVLYSLQIAI